MSEPAELLLIKDQYELAYSCLSRGLSLEESGGSPSEAGEYYRKGRQHLVQGIAVPTEGPRHQGAVWEQARELQRRMQGALVNVSTHLSALDASQAPPPAQRRRLLMDLTPSLDPVQHLYPSLIPDRQLPPLPARRTPPAMSEAPAQPPVYSPQPADGHRSLAGGPGLDEWSVATAERGSELLLIPSGVQMFFVAPSGQVSALSQPGYLRIVNFNSQTPDGKGPVFLDVCGWLHPLTENTPVLLANSGIYMLPDTLAPMPNAFIGVVLSSQLPVANREMFQDLMRQLADFRVQSPDSTGSEVISLSETVHLGPQVELPVNGDKVVLPTWSEKMGQGIMTGATRLGHEVARGAEATTRAIQKGAMKIRDRLTPEDTPSEVSPQVTKGLQVAKDATGSALRVSQYLVEAVSTMAEHLAEKVVPHVKKHGAKLIPESMKSKEGEPSNLQGAKFVAAKSLLGFTTVWASLETGAKLVGKSVTSETVNTVTYKYGNDAGQATDTALTSVTNVGETAYNVDNLGLKAILKTTGKEMAKGIVKSSKSAGAAADEGKEGTPQGEQAATNDIQNTEVQRDKVDKGKKET
ncbi:spartin a isoform X2 [Corythoichthys intestinalis]|uniref:spartin a isoform X2 n=1 Tax=Corythoichthys intestinalis TaxID=161448 RepID=UPI0025A4FAFE|nr:spartin a isoform X2 [Corythoichthys intestinalis]XP_061801894.1 spartin-like [Nerophis lumbriciformis]